MSYRILILLLFLYSNAFAIEIPTKKEFPPYPDIWGYDISNYPIRREYPSGIFEYKIRNGDFWFKFLSEFVENTKGDTIKNVRKVLTFAQAINNISMTIQPERISISIFLL